MEKKADRKLGHLIYLIVFKYLVGALKASEGLLEANSKA